MRVLSERGLALCFCLSFVLVFVLALGVLYPVLLRVFTEKNRVTTAIMLSLDDTLDDEDVLVIFGELQV